MKYLASSFSLILLASCSTSGLRMNEEMLPDGTWKMSFPKKLVCQGKEKQGLSMNDARKSFEGEDEVSSLSSEEKKQCLADYKSDFDSRAKELCPTPKYRVFGCYWESDKRSFSSHEFVTCYVKCGEQK